MGAHAGVPLISRCLGIGLGLVFGLLGCGQPAGGGGEPPLDVQGGAGTSAAGASGAGAGGGSSGGGGAGGSASVGAGASATAGAAGASVEGGSAGTAVGGAGGAPMVGVFVAQGHEGRITRSCDDGLSFAYNHSDDDSFRCFTDAEHDCDHSADAGRGLAFGNGAFVATWGWGHPGKLQRSLDGKAWADVMTETPTFADVAYGNGSFVACGNPTRVSSDGQIWEMGGKLSFDFNYRGIEFVPTAGGLFVVGGESGSNRAISFSKDGKQWAAAQERPDLCGEQLRGIAGSNDALILVSAKGHVCRSTDGNTWTFAQVAERFTSPPVWTGSEFWVYAGPKLYQSADGTTWTSKDIDPPNLQIGALARSPAGTLVAANDGWQVWYEKQQFFRSTDGVHWTVLPPTAFTGSHPINFISFGYVPASAACGAP